ncbi:MAG: hypothetical protein C0399_08165 [Syntrophus sp. (in: bacteria)]|nr:hypothetical protein [Syntrophus sp. (in: bacteria)]
MRKLLLVTLLILTGCSTVGNVIPISGDTYTVTSSGHYTSWSGLKTEGIQLANEFCAKKNKHMAIVSWETHGVRGWSPQEAELTFKCSTELPTE